VRRAKRRACRIGSKGGGGTDAVCGALARYVASVQGVRGLKAQRELLVRFGDTTWAPQEWLHHTSTRLRAITGTAVNSGYALQAGRGCLWARPPHALSNVPPCSSRAEAGAVPVPVVHANAAPVPPPPAPNPAPRPRPPAPPPSPPLPVAEAAPEASAEAVVERPPLTIANMLGQCT
jgi:hypothetical protein